ncbi:MAG: Rrf2 family transcriptional regulator [Candidatus Omnitrophica bacterium]|nr:Rrf2 family transcriptional regulator [Candidatus Omnitrophota bacterium]
MRLINKNIYYAIRSLLYIAQRPYKNTSVSEVVNKLKMRRAFLRRILQILSKKKILKSLKGKGGGFVLNTPASKLRLIDIIKIFRGRIDIMDCLLEKDICPYPDDCVLMAHMKDIKKRLHRVLAETTIATLLKNRDGRI